MGTPVRSSVVDYAIIAVGVCLAFLAALVPFYGSGYRLQLGVLLAGLLPYLVYALAVALLQRPFTVIAGLVLLALYAWLVVLERFAGDADYSDGLIYYGPWCWRWRCCRCWSWPCDSPGAGRAARAGA